MRASFVACFALVIAAGAGLGCNVIIGVDEPDIRPGSGGSGGAGGAAGSGGSGGASCAPAEVDCDGKDDDCNGSVDDLPLLTCGIGVCKVSVQACVEGMPGECSPGPQTPNELCDGDGDGLDDDCDGMVDEGCPCVKGETQPCYTGAPSTRNIGACKDGVQECVQDGVFGPCVGDVLPAAETCNAVDDDCNGTADEGYPEETCGIGACQVTITKCGPTDMCVPKEGTAEVCNGLDDDCNGVVDNGAPGSGMSCMTGLFGACGAGMTSCQGGTLACIPNVQPTMEVCNGLDDDCDGMADQGNPGGGGMCPTGKLGECAVGTKICDGGALYCDDPDPGLETCNGLDDDCNGEIDDHGTDAGKPCTTGVPGECSAGLTLCVNANLECKQSAIPTTEVCDSKDNDCDGMTDESFPGEGAACVYPGLKGECAKGVDKCTGGFVTCTQTVMPTLETCDGKDNDCDGDIDEGATCGTCGSSVIGSAACASIPLPSPVTLTESCKQVFPPAASLPVPISNPGTQYYVSPLGLDSNDGLSPTKPWATLCHAIAAAPPGSTIQAAQGFYVSSNVVVSKALTVKGGYSTNFANWNPDTYKTIYHGQLTLDHNMAVWGGFRMISNPVNTAQVRHYLKAGSFLHNYVEVVFGGAISSSIGIDATACGAATTILQGNDIFVGSNSTTTVTNHKGIQTGYQSGATTLEGNRICMQGKAGAISNYALFGYGPNASSTAAKIIIKNNLIESAGAESALVRFEGSSGAVDYPIVLTNNTLLALNNGLQGTAATGGKMRWRVTNNVLFSMTTGSTAINLGSGTGVSFDSAENNLIFGFNSNLLNQPAPVTNVLNDLSATAAASVFIDPTNGDFKIVTAGKADGTAKNVYNDATYGSVTMDILQLLRPTAGAWDRGAYKN